LTFFLKLDYFLIIKLHTVYIELIYNEIMKIIYISFYNYKNTQ